MRGWKPLLKGTLIACGLALSLVPAVGGRISAASQKETLRTSLKKAEATPSADLDAILEEARDWNAGLVNRTLAYTNLEERGKKAGYSDQLDWMSDGVMGALSIPRLSLELPIFHGTDEQSLVKGVGHVEWSSLPCGGEGTLALLSSHRGMAAASLFTRLDEMEPGDLFLIENPKETLAYRVYDVETVLPQETETLVPEAGRDRVTLVTCTPYGINTHRLLVHGERTDWSETIQEEVHQVKSTPQKPGMIQLFLDLWPLLLGLMVFAAWISHHRKNGSKHRVRART